MLVEHDSVDADFLGQLVLGQPIVVELRAGDGVEVGVGEEQRGHALLGGMFVVGRHRLLGEVHQVHGGPFSGGGLSVGSLAGDSAALAREWEGRVAPLRRLAEHLANPGDFGVVSRDVTEGVVP